MCKSNREPKRCHDLRAFNYACALKPGLKCKNCEWYHNRIYTDTVGSRTITTK